MDRWKSRGGKSQRGEEKNRQDQRRERVRRKRMQVREKVEKLRIVFPMICGSGGSKSRLAKAAGAEPSGQMRDESCTPLWHEAHLCRSQNVQNTPCSEHFWKMRCRKSARRCGEKRSSKSKCIKHRTLGANLEVAMSKKCAPLCGEMHVSKSKCTAWKLRCRKSARRCGAKHISKSKVQKIDGYRALLDVQMSFFLVGARGCAPCQKGAKRESISSSFKSNGRRGTFEEDLQRYFSHGRRSTRDT